MDAALLAQLGSGGLLTFLVFKEAMGFVSRRKVKADSVTPRGSFNSEDREMLKDLHRWHNKTDEDGVPVWYVRKSLEDAIRSIGENLKLQTEILREMSKDFTRHADRAEQMEKIHHD